jgi:hypothetical protein
MTRLEVKRLDSPLRRSSSQPAAPAAEQDTAPAPSPPELSTATAGASAASKGSRKRSPAPAPESRRLSTVAGRGGSDDLGDELARLPEPPELDESLELVSSRIPVSLRRLLSELTNALREQGGGRVSQKGLPEQEVLAVLVWAAGSADDPEAVRRLERTLKAYRARRFAAAAEKLSS